MTARLLKFIPLLLINVCIALHLFAQQRMATDSIVDLYADTGEIASEYFLVKFRTYPGAALLQRYGLVRSLSAQHHILQYATFDSTAAQQILQVFSANHNWKCNEQLVKAIGALRSKDSMRIQVSYTGDINQLKYCSVSGPVSRHPVVMATVKKEDWRLFTAQKNVRFVDRVRSAHTEITISNALPSINYINAVQQQYPELRGARHTVGLKEERFDTTDVDLLGKAIPSPLAAPTVNPHATIMATLIAGTGNSGPRGKGVAVQARLSSSDYQRLLPDDNDYFKNARITLQNHSYGTAIENYYGAEAAAYDLQVYALDTLLHIFSSGNIGNTAPSDGAYKGITGYANLSGTFKQAKNVLVAGGIDTGYNIPALSSRGPAYDGRMSPQVVAYGQSGTSDAAAITTGIAALVQEAYQQAYHITPSAAMVKALLINTADDTGIPGPDYRSGFGVLNALAAIRAVKDKQFYTGEVTAGNTISFPLTISPNTARIKVTLIWNDPAASENSGRALLNDLDLFITDNTGYRHLPWVLSAFPSADSLGAPARRGIDSINNTEQVTIDMPNAGSARIHVHARTLRAGAAQRFSIAYQLIPRSAFEWQYPVTGEQLTVGKNVAVRWHTPSDGNGTLSFSVDSGATWTQIAVDVPLISGNCRWNIPSVFSKGLLRMTTADTAWTSSYFNISEPVALNVGFNCPDTLMLYWPLIQHATSYDCYALQNGHLSRLASTTDSFLLISKAELSSPYIAVLPVHKDGWDGMQSTTYNYEQQGVSCFFRQLLVDVQDDNSVDITVTLSTLLRVKKIFWERLQNNNFITLSSQDININDQYIYKDRPARSGIHFYRIKIELTDGRYIYSDTQSIQLLLDQEFHLFPVPAAQELTLITRNIGDYQVRFTDMNGRTIFAQPLTQVRQTYSLKGIAPGIYLCVIYEGAKKIYVRRFIKAAD
jgi:hypothetical protein